MNATCIGCGCDDMHACWDADNECGCFWVRLDRRAGQGVCSACETHVHAWDINDRTPRALPVRESKPSGGPPKRVANPPTGRPQMRAGEHCPHAWPFQDVQDSDRCTWCSIGFLRHVFMECP